MLRHPYGKMGKTGAVGVVDVMVVAAFVGPVCIRELVHVLWHTGEQLRGLLFITLLA